MTFYNNYARFWSIYFNAELHSRSLSTGVDKVDIDDCAIKYVLM